MRRSSLGLRIVFAEAPICTASCWTSHSRTQCLAVRNLYCGLWWNCRAPKVIMWDAVYASCLV